VAAPEMHEYGPCPDNGVSQGVLAKAGLKAAPISPAEAAAVAAAYSSYVMGRLPLGRRAVSFRGRTRAGGGGSDGEARALPVPTYKQVATASRAWFLAYGKRVLLLHRQRANDSWHALNMMRCWSHEF
jgi:hypothetical protein